MCRFDCSSKHRFGWRWVGSRIEGLVSASVCQKRTLDTKEEFSRIKKNIKLVEQNGNKKR